MSEYYDPLETFAQLLEIGAEVSFKTETQEDGDLRCELHAILGPKKDYAIAFLVSPETRAKGGLEFTVLAPAFKAISHSMRVEEGFEQFR